MSITYQEAVAYSHNYATAKPDIGTTEKEHILGLCDALEQIGTERDAYKDMAHGMSSDLDSVGAERNALSVHVERFNELYRRATEEDAGWMTNSHVVKEYAAICRDTPDTSLARLKAQWQAEVATRIFCDLEAEFDPCHPIIERVGHIESEYLSQAGGEG